MTGSTGAQLAADFIAEQFTKAGLTPRGQSNTFFQSFDFNAGVRVLTNQNRFTIATNLVGRGVLTAPQNNADATRRAEDSAPYQQLAFQAEKDFRPLAFTSNGTASGEVVFVGYGLAVPGKAGEGYDSYAGLNVSNKIVLALRYVPEEVDAKRRQELNRYAGLRYKAMLARERGAKAILFVTGPNSPNAGELAALASDSASGGSGIIAASVTTNVIAPMFAAARRDLKSVQSQLDKEDPARGRRLCSLECDSVVDDRRGAHPQKRSQCARRTGRRRPRHRRNSFSWARTTIISVLARAERCRARARKTKFILARTTMLRGRHWYWNLRDNWRATQGAVSAPRREQVTTPRSAPGTACPTFSAESSSRSGRAKNWACSARRISPSTRR